MINLISYAVKNEISDKAYNQLSNLLSEYPNDIECAQLMPDAHYCNGAVPVGTILKIKGGIDPDWVSADIGCGVSVLKVQGVDKSKFGELDLVLQSISHRNTNDLGEIGKVRDKIISLLNAACPFELNDNLVSSIGSIGGGNHFVEVSEYNGEYYIVVHSGSRAYGGFIYRMFKNIAKSRKQDPYINDLVNLLKDSGRKEHINEFIKLYKETARPSNLLYGKDLDAYVEAVRITNGLASVSRLIIAKSVADVLCGTDEVEIISETSHNSITKYSNGDVFVHKGAVIFNELNDSAVYAIPINMRDGTMLCSKNKDNKDWFGLPHGAGRLLSRTEAKSKVSIDEYRDMMNGIYSSTISLDTIDEAPSVYKSIDEIRRQVSDTCNVLGVLKPIYSFKCSEH